MPRPSVRGKADVIGRPSAPSVKSFVRAGAKLEPRTSTLLRQCPLAGYETRAFMLAQAQDDPTSHGRSSWAVSLPHVKARRSRKTSAIPTASFLRASLRSTGRIVIVELCGFSGKACRCSATLPHETESSCHCSLPSGLGALFASRRQFSAFLRHSSALNIAQPTSRTGAGRVLKNRENRNAGGWQLCQAVGNVSGTHGAIYGVFAAAVVNHLYVCLVWLRGTGPHRKLPARGASTLTPPVYRPGGESWSNLSASDTAWIMRPSMPNITAK